MADDGATGAIGPREGDDAPRRRLALSWLVEGPQAIGGALAGSLTAAAMPALLGLVHTCLVATAVAGGIWTWLMTHHPAGRVAPFSMLVPVVGLSTAWLVPGEVPRLVEILGGAVVIAGVLMGSLRPPPRTVDAPTTHTGARMARTTPAGTHGSG